MSLGVIPIFWFEFLGAFWRKIANRGKHEKIGHKPLRHGEGWPRRGPK